jgi:outer membrane protein assembly factor BamA
MMMRRHTSSASGGIRPILFVGILVLILSSGGVWAQDSAGTSSLNAMNDSDYVILESVSDAASNEISWPAGVGMPGQVAGWKSQLLRWYQSHAFFSTQIDSVNHVDRTVRVLKGEATLIRSVDIRYAADFGNSDDYPFELDTIMRGWEGEAASKEHLESLVTAALEELSMQGFLAARVSIADLIPLPKGLDVVVLVEPGVPTLLEAIILEGDSRTKPGIVASALGLRDGQTLENVPFEQIRSDVAALGWYDAVYQPRYELTSDSSAVIVIPVTPLSPGQFDLVVGALPSSGDTGATVIGSGHLELANAFGRGRLLEAQVNRLPGQASSARLNVETPAPRGWPLVVQFGLEGHQQDSTWNQTRLASKVLFRIDRGTWLGATYSAERTRSGFSGNEFEGSQQLVPRSSMQLGGMTLRIQRLDHPRFPRQGFFVESVLERGLRTSQTREIVGADTVSVRRSQRRERLIMELDLYLMSGSRLGWAAGIDVSAIRAGRPDISELLFLGGASSLRGYDENRFQGSTVGRAFVEARWYVDRSTWGFLFYDAGWVALDADFEDGLPALISRSEGYHPGYGFGFVFSSAVGPIALSYALNPDESLRTGRVHLGLSFGL